MAKKTEVVRMMEVLEAEWQKKYGIPQREVKYPRGEPNVGSKAGTNRTGHYLSPPDDNRYRWSIYD